MTKNYRSDPAASRTGYALVSPIRIVIPLQPVTKKNSQRILATRGGRRFIAPSVVFEQYQRDAGWHIGNARHARICDRVNVRCLFYMGTRRSPDLTNLLEAADDVLVYYGVLIDDNAAVIAAHDGSRVLYDKIHPRTEIYIDRMTED